jgi:hypothetical protein
MSPRLAPWLAFCLMCWPAALAAGQEAQAKGQEEDSARGKAEEGTSGDEAQREDEMFGGEEEPAAPVASPDALAGSFDEPVRSSGLISDLLARADNPLTVGGSLSLRFQYAWADEHAAGQANLLSSPSRLYLFLDARPSERLRAFARGRLTYDFTLQDGRDGSGLPAEALGTALDELWLKADIGQVVYLTLGRQPVRWGSGRFWNPTDVLNAQRRDPLAFLDERVGPTLVKLHFPVESLGWNLYAVASLDNAKGPEDIGGALRGEFLFGPVELAASLGYRKDRPLKLGLDASCGVWLLDLRLEAAVTYDERAPHWKGRFAPEAPVFPTAEVRDTRWIPQVTAGLEVQIQYSDEDYFILGAEYFFNDMGYPGAELYDWLLLETFQGRGGFSPFYLGRHYAAGYLVLLYPGSWNDTVITLSGLGNLSDRTGLVRLDWRVRLLTYLDLAFFGAVRLGGRGEFHYGVTVPPLTGVPGVPEAYQQGFSIPAARLELGLWLTLAL